MERRARRGRCGGRHGRRGHALDRDLDEEERPAPDEGEEERAGAPAESARPRQRPTRCGPAMPVDAATTLASCPGPCSSAGCRRSPSGSKRSATSCGRRRAARASSPRTADDARLRALVSETPLAEQRAPRGPAATPTPWRATGPTCSAELAELERAQDELLDRLVAETADADRDRQEPAWPIRVVIAEDEAIIRLDLKETLEEEGYEVVGETGRGDEAVELVRELEPDLAILDIKMPGLDGLVGGPRDRRRAPGRGADPHRLQPARPRSSRPATPARSPTWSSRSRRASCIPAVEVALGRFREMKALDDEVARPRGAARDPQARRPGQGHAHGRARPDRGRRVRASSRRRR